MGFNLGRLAKGIVTGGASEVVPYVKNMAGYGAAPQQPTVAQGSAANPNVAYQAQQNFGTSGNLLGRLGQSDAEHAGALSGQNQLVGQLNNTITNPNAPSVAATQLAQSNDLLGRQALGASAGVSGPNAFAARRQALNSISQGNLDTAGNAALLRANEVAHAQQQQGNVLGQMSQSANQRGATDITGAGNFANTAGNEQEKQQGMNQSAEETSAKRSQVFTNKLLSGIASFAGAGGGGGG